MVSTRWVRAEPQSAAAVRRDIARTLLDDGIAADVVDDVQLVASELVGNAVRHARALPAGLLRVSWEQSAGGITISVTDGGGTHRPRARQAEPLDTTGRGLSIVSALTDFWGVNRSSGTVTVWAHLPGRRAASNTPIPA